MNNKKKIIISAMVVALIVVIGVVFVTSKKAVINPDMNATVKKAPFGCLVTVRLTESGKKTYVGATKYQIYNKDKAISTIWGLSEPTTVYPVKKAGEVVQVKLFDNKLNVIKTTDVELKAE